MATPIQIKLIHTLKGALSLDDDTYRTILSGYGVKSSTKLSPLKAAQLIKDLEEKATAAGVWKKKPAARAQSVRRLADDPQSRMLRGMWIDLFEMGVVRNPAESALCAFGKRLTRKDALQWYSDRDVTVVKEALKQMGARGKEADNVA